MKSRDLHEDLQMHPPKHTVGRLIRLVLLSVAVLLALPIFALGAVYGSLHLTVSSYRLTLSGDQLAVMSASPYALHYSARLYEDMGSQHILHRLPRYQAIWIIGSFFYLFRDDYAQVVARHIPFRQPNTPQLGTGITDAASTLFHTPVQQLTAAQLTLLDQRSAAPQNHPIITAQQ